MTTRNQVGGEKAGTDINLSPPYRENFDRDRKGKKKGT